MNGGILVREDERNKDAQGGKERGGGGGVKDDVNKWKSSAGHVSRRGVLQVSTGVKTNDEGACGNTLLIVWRGRRYEFNIKEKSRCLLV